jgi:hypothetical protein
MMMTRIKKCLYLLLLIPLCGWTQPADFGTWCSVGIKKKINKKFSASLTEQLRMYDNSTRLNVFYSDIGIGYKINDFFKVSAYYRNIIKNVEYQQYSYRHRFYADIEFRTSYEQMEFKFRTRFEREINQTVFSEKDLIPGNVNRNKFNLSYKMEDFEPFVSYEIFIPFSNTLAEFEKERYSVGLSYKFTKNLSCNLFYLLQRSLQPEFDRWNVLGVDLMVDF